MYEVELLQAVGLTGTDAKVYLALLKCGSSTGGGVAKASGLYKANVYASLERLAGLGLASYVEREGKTYFEAADPSRLVQIMEEKKARLQAVLPSILLMHDQLVKQEVKVFAGKEGLKTIIEDIVKTKPSEWLDFTSGRTTVLLSHHYMTSWNKRRIKAKIKARMLVNQTPEGITRARELRQLSYTEVRFLPPDLKSPSHIYIYGSKVALTLWSEDNPFGVLVDNRKIAERFKEFFNWFWKLSYRSPTRQSSKLLKK